MIIGPGFVFVSTPKAGTHTLYQILQEKFDGIFMAHVKGYPEQGQYHPRLVPKEFRDVFRFTVVRNPYARAVSIWWCLVNMKPYNEQYPPLMGGVELKDFAKWVRAKWRVCITHRGLNGAVMLMPQAEWHSPQRFHAVLKIENLQNEFNDLPFVKEPIEVPNVHSFRDQRKPWREHYDDETAYYIQDWCGGDFPAYGYDREGYKPCTLTS